MSLFGTPTKKEAEDSAYIQKMIADKKPVAEIIKELKARGYDKEAKMAEASSGLVSTLTGYVTGIPDLLKMGYEKVTGAESTPSFRERALTGMGFPTEPTVSKGLYYAPEVISGAVGVAELGRAGRNFYKMWRKNSKLKEFTKTLPEDTQNAFKKWMVTGQGSDDPKVAAVIQHLKTDTNYAEMFHELERQATNAAIKDVAKSRLSNTQASDALASRVSAELDGAVKARSEAGNRAFERAFGYAGDKSFIRVDGTLAQIRNMREEYAQKGTPAAQKAVEFLQGLEDQIVRSINVPGSQGTTMARAATETTGVGMRPGPLGVPVEAATTTTIPGANINIPGAAGYTTTTAPQLFSVPKLQAWLADFGKKAAQGDSMVNQLGIDDQQRISSALFGSLKDDLKNAYGYLSDKNDRLAVRFLQEARQGIADASNNYNKLIAKGMPKFLQGKSINEVGFDDLFKAYQTMPKDEKVVFRQMVKNTDAEALKNIDARMVDEFKRMSQGINDAGNYGLNLKQLGINWAKMAPEEQEAMAMSLGTSAKEFSKRMQDALVFTKQMNVRQPQQVAGTLERLAPEAARVAGATVGYQAHQAVMTAADTIKKLKSAGMTDELLMKALLNPEAAAALKSARLSKSSQEMLSNLTKIDSIDNPLPAFALTAGQTNRPSAPQEPVQAPQSVESAPVSMDVPADLFGGSQQQPEQQQQQTEQQPVYMNVPNDLFQ